jgi:hypothetical protein
MKISLTFMILFVSVSAAFCQRAGYSAGNIDCSVLKKHPLRYMDLKDSSAYILLGDDSAVEYHNDGRNKLTARIEWINDCEYNLILSSVTTPGFAYQPGDVMHIRIDRIEQGIVYYFSTINGNGWEGKLRIGK